MSIPAFSSHTTGGRGLTVQVFAKGGKGKGKTSFRGNTGVPGQGAEMVRREPPVPEVDPENAEFVIFVRSKKFIDPMTQKLSTGVSPWVPLSVLKGSTAANFLLKILETEWGKVLYGNTLIRQIAQGVYKDREDVEKAVRKNYPPFANSGSKDFEYAFKIRDKTEPKDWSKADNLINFPPESELGATGVDQLRKFFSPESIASMFKAPEGPVTGGTSSSAPQP